jgi:two-component system LytT family sensor kinase
MGNENRKLVVRHLLVWLIFIAYEMAYLYITVGIQASVFHYIIYYTLNIGLFYFNAYVILDYAFFKTNRGYILSVALIFLEITGYLILKYFLDYLLASPHHSLQAQLKTIRLYFIANVWRGLYFIGLSIAYWSMLYFLRFREKNQLMETEQLKDRAKTLELENKYITVENAYLQNQISPHLLFNSLNFIYTKIYKESAEAGDSVSRLSDLMRYSLAGADDSRTVLLSQEVTQIANLVELCRMRFRDQFYLRFKKLGMLSAVQIIPLILITLVENMMKHGDMGDKKYPAKILLELNGNHLSFETFNKKRNTNLYPKNGLGLKNIEKRLSNYYHERFQLLTRDETEFFTVNLTIDL